MNTKFLIACALIILPLINYADICPILPPGQCPQPLNGYDSWQQANRCGWERPPSDSQLPADPLDFKKLDPNGVCVYAGSNIIMKDGYLIPQFN